MALTTLDLIEDESEELVLKGISIYQQSNPKNIHIYDFFALYDTYGLELTKFAHRELVKIGNNNLDNLLDAMTYQIEEGVKAEGEDYLIDSLELLKEFKNDKSVKFLINLLKDHGIFKEKCMARTINELLVNFGSKAITPLTNLLFDADIEKRKESARALGKSRDTRAITALAQTLCNDTSENVKYYASESLAKIGFPAVNAFLQVIQDKNPTVRRLAAGALGEIGDQRALQPLTRVLQDTDLDVRIRAHESIEKICKTHNLNPQQFIQQSQSKNRGITEMKNNHSNQVDDPAQRLKKVKELLDMGAITKEEFERKKKQLLDRI